MPERIEKEEQRVFNRNALTIGRAIDDPSDDEIKATPSLWNASYDDAARFGGELTRVALGQLDLVGDRKHVTVDSKVHMLMYGMYPAIPGWHTDGVPREDNGRPSGGTAKMWLQDGLDAEHAPRYHLLVTGSHCSTEFLNDEFAFDGDGPNLYRDMTLAVNSYLLGVSKAGGERPVIAAPASTWVHWDWWNIHRAIPAKKAGWRLLIRVTESDFMEPQADVRQVIRLHNPVYLTETYGW